MTSENATQRTIIVNGREFKVDKGEITYEEVVKLAYPDATFGGNIVYTVTYKRSADPSKPQGVLVEGGESVRVKNNMKFDVRRTDKS